MSQLVVGTTVLSPDEPCFNLSEINLQAPDSRGWRRYQVLLVVRGDRLAEFRSDLGPARRFTAQQFRIPGGVRDEVSGRIEILHTVGELRDIADRLRAGLVRPPELAPTDLVAGYHETLEERRRRRRGRSTFGPLARRQRSRA